MLNSLFVNASILISFIYLGSQFLKNQKINSNAKRNTKITIGLLFGLTGCLLMFNGIDLSGNMIMDFRIIALIVSAIYCGPLSALITAFIIAIFRFVYFGIYAASFTALFNLTILSIICSVISVSSHELKIKYIYMSVANVISSAIWIMILVKDMQSAVKILFEYTFSNLIVSFVIYFVLVYIFNTNELYLKLKQDSSKDFLTGLYNVREFDRLLNKASIAVVNKQENLSLLMIDLDYFKKVNDTFGHSSGDMVLKQFSDILVNSCRSFDFISRNGGEEFTAVLLDCDYEKAMDIAEGIRRNVEEYSFLIENHKRIRITVSIGVSSYPDKTDNPNNLLQEADSALYLAKHQGRNKVN